MNNTIDPQELKLYYSFPGYDRFDFPEGIYRVTAGMGGESLLISGEKYVALYDTGMAYPHQALIGNIRRVLAKLGRDRVDIILLSHTHYDHIGALPYLLKEWPEAVVVAADKARSVFASEGARRTMKRLGEVARDSFSDSSEPVITDGLRVDWTVGDGSRIDIGGRWLDVLETGGHTDCSLTYVLQPDSIMFLSESTGIMRGQDEVRTTVLKSFPDSIKSARKCKEYHPERIIVPHYGIVPEFYTQKYFDVYLRELRGEINLVCGLAQQGMNEEQILEQVEQIYWFKGREYYQTKEAFRLNTGISIRLILKTYGKDGIPTE